MIRDVVRWLVSAIVCSREARWRKENRRRKVQRGHGVTLMDSPGYGIVIRSPKENTDG